MPKPFKRKVRGPKLKNTIPVFRGGYKRVRRSKKKRRGWI